MVGTRLLFFRRKNVKKLISIVYRKKTTQVVPF